MCKEHTVVPEKLATGNSSRGSVHSGDNSFQTSSSINTMGTSHSFISYCSISANLCYYYFIGLLGAAFKIVMF